VANTPVITTEFKMFIKLTNTLSWIRYWITTIGWATSYTIAELTTKNLTTKISKISVSYYNCR